MFVFGRRLKASLKLAGILFLSGGFCLLMYRAFQPQPLRAGDKKAAALVQRLKWPESFAAASELIQQLKGIGEPSLAPLLETLESPHGDEFYILEALREMGRPSVMPLIHFVESHESFLSVDDWWLAGRLPQWCQKQILTPSDEYSIKRSAYRLLVEMAPSDQAVLDLLIQGTGDDDEFNRAYAVLFMGMMDARFENQIVSTLAQQTTDPSLVVRHRVVTVLGQFAKTSASAYETLVVLLNDTAPEIRRVVARAIGETGKVDEPTHRKLLLGLKDKNGGCRVASAGALWRLGRDREAAMGVIEDQLRDRIELSRTLKVVESIGPEMIGLAEEIESLFEHTDDTIRVLAMHCHWALTGADARFVSNLADIISHGSLSGKFRAVGSLGLLGSKAREAFPSLIAVARNDSHLMREALQAFEKIGPPATEAIPFIEEALNHRAPIIQKAAHDALIAIRASPGDK